MSVSSDVSEIVFQSRGVQGILADFARMENAARSFERLQANAYYAPAGAQRDRVQSLLGDAVRNAGLEAATRAARASTAAISLLKTEVGWVKEAIGQYAQYGRTVQNIQSLSGASLGSSEKFANLARVAGVPDQQAVREIMRLSQDMFSTKGKSALSQLGISGQGKDSLQVFEEATAALSKMQNGARKTSIEMQLFGGRLTQSLQPFLHISPEILKRTNELSSTFDGRALQAINDFTGSTNLLGLTIMKDLVYPVADALLPSLTWLVLEVQAGVEWVRKLDEMMGGALKWAAIFTGVAATVGTLVVAFKGLQAAYVLINEQQAIQNGLLVIKDALSGPKGWAALAVAGVVTAGIGINHYMNSDDKDSGAGDTMNNAAQTLQQGAATFAGAVNGLARSLQSIGGSEISGNMTEGDLALVLQRAAQGLG